MKSQQRRSLEVSALGTSIKYFLLVALSLDRLLGVLSTWWRGVVGLDLEVLLLLRIWIVGHYQLLMGAMQGHDKSVQDAN